MRYFYDQVPWYKTCGVNYKIAEIHCMKCITMISDMIDTGVPADYLQVFNFNYDPQKKEITIKHSQEEPEYERTLKYIIGDDTEPFEGKVYIIDDIDHRTILLAEEY